jgi:hypothetical protein
VALGAWVLVGGFSTWNYSFLFSVLGTTLSHPNLWIISTSNNAKVLCHLSCLVEAFNWVLKYFKETLSVKTLVLCLPRKCCHIFKQDTIMYNSFCGSAITIVPHRVFWSRR